MTEAMDMTDSSFPTDVMAMRARAYEGDVQTPGDLARMAMASEQVCVLRYRMHAIAVAGITIKSIDAEFAIHAKGEQAPMTPPARRIGQPGGSGEGGALVETVRQVLTSMQMVIDFFRRPRAAGAHHPGQDPHRRGRTYDRYA
ncbi:bacterioferritin [Gluconacetobacter johannae DSM 13595]|uniref:hypothetical protein n=1 Tax=Gluconacetobacter johannae TaxID=112140 RepID=UPI0016032ACB|nr:hypothetical protein [Gluconacetobacter johannae]GBQ85266.1 bacterioferritin [Gluconacetobacter johannae DSM 13595]